MFVTRRMSISKMQEPACNLRSDSMYPGRKDTTRSIMYLQKRTNRSENLDTYLNHKLYGTCCIIISTNNNHNIDIADSHVKERASTCLPNMTGFEFLCLHYVCSECIHHISIAYVMSISISIRACVNISFLEFLKFKER